MAAIEVIQEWNENWLSPDDIMTVKLTTVSPDDIMIHDRTVKLTTSWWHYDSKSDISQQNCSTVHWLMSLLLI